MFCRLNWDVEGETLRARSRAIDTEFMSPEYVITKNGGTAWSAEFQGLTICDGTLLACIEACELQDVEAMEEASTEGARELERIKQAVRNL